MIDCGGKINTMTPVHTIQMDPAIKFIDVGTQKVYGFPPKVHVVVSIKLLVSDKKDSDRFFEEILLLANTNMEVVLGIFFVFLSNADIDFEIKGLTWRSFITAETLPNKSRIQLIDKHKFAKVISDKNLETFVIHVAALEATRMTIYLSRAN